MKNRILVLFSFLMAFAISMPVLAVSEEAAATAAAEEKAPVAEEKTPAEEKAPVAEEKTPSETKAPAAETKAEPAAPAEIKSGDEAATVTRELLDAARGGKWSVVVACGIMLLVFLVNRVPAIGAKLGSKAKPWLAAATSIAGYIAAALLVDHTTMVDAILGGFMTGASAVGLWEMVFKHFMKPADPAPAAPSA